MSRLRLLVVNRLSTTDIVLPEHGEVVIGRESGCAVAISDARASRQHAILRIGARIELVDLGGRNGTIVDGRRLAPKETVVLSPASVVRIGSTVLVLERARVEHPEQWVFSEERFDERIEAGLANVEAGAHVAMIELRYTSSPGSHSTTSTEGAEAVTTSSRIRHLLARVLGADDVAGAFRSSSFALLLGKTTQERARHLARHLRGSFEQEGIACDVGVAISGIDGTTATELSARAARPWNDAVVAPPVVLTHGIATKLEGLLAKLDATDSTILIVGETGVGKEVLARTIHMRSRRASKPLVTVNCATLTETLFESELFGHERGAFTGAHQPKVGLIEAADSGTLFFDEVGELPLLMQPKLLRVLEHREVQRVGSVRPRSVDVRFLFATNRLLEDEVSAGRFRSDLFFRINGATLNIPPLRERPDEIVRLATTFLQDASSTLGQAAPVISDQALQVLSSYDWPGNVRELRNVVEMAAMICDGDVLLPAHLPIHRLLRKTSTPAAPPSTELSERDRIVQALESCAGNQSAAARLLGMPRRTLVKRLGEYGLPRPRK